LDINAMQEAGEGGRAMLAAKGTNDANQIALRRVMGDERMQEAGMQEQAVDMQSKQLGLDAAKRMEAVQQAYINEQDPVKKRELGKQWLTLQGKDTSKYQIVSRKDVGPNGITPTETAYAVNPDNPSESFEIGGQADIPEMTAPPPVDQRKVGQRIRTPKGTFTWTGQGWAAAE
jgi:hypothetical protein